jgi:hypothetical protein
VTGKEPGHVERSVPRKQGILTSLDPSTKNKFFQTLAEAKDIAIDESQF